MNDTRATIIASIILAVVTAIAVVLLVEAPAYVTERSIETFEAEQRVEATLMASHLSARLDALQDRLELPMITERSWDRRTSQNQMRDWLDAATHASDAQSGIYLFVHDSEGNILAVSPETGPDTPAFANHTHQLEPKDGSGFGVCHACLTKLDALSIEVPVGDGVYVGANIDAHDLASRVFNTVLNSPNVLAALLDSTGEPLFEFGDRTIPRADTVSAKVAVPNTSWTVEVTAPTSSVAGELRAGSRRFMWLGGGLLLSVIVGLIGFVTWYRRREKRRARRQQALVHQDKLATVGTLASSVAHEIGNTITIAKSNLHFLGQAASQDNAEAVDDAISAVERLEGLAGDLSKFVSGRSDEQEPIELTDVVESARRIVEPKLKHDATIRISADPVNVLGRKRALVQVVVNLLLNAYDATPEGTRCEIDVTVERRDGRARLIVRDHGEGIPAPMLDKIFDAFVTTKGSESLGGTGLGLWLCSRTVSQHDGQIRAENADDGGARFTLDFPLTGSNT